MGVDVKMIKVLFATGNETKAKRFSKGLEEKGIEKNAYQFHDEEWDCAEMVLKK